MAGTGLFFTLEGIDGSGKSTQMQMLAEALRALGHNVVTTFEPGDTNIGKIVRQAVLELHEEVDPMAEMLLFAADRAQHVKHLILPALEEGKIVISDRYADSTEVYQGVARGFQSGGVVAQVIELATGGLKPDLTLFYDISVEEAIRRTQNRVETGKGLDRLDKEKLKFHELGREGYMAIAAREPERFRVIEANVPPDELHRKTMTVVVEFLKSREK
jgi:dTMP kinase